MSSRKCAIPKITWMEHGPRWTNDKIDYKIHIHSSFCIMLKSETICRLCRDSGEYRASHKLHHDILIRMVFLWVGCARQTIQCLLVSLYAIDIIRIIIRRQFAFWLAYKWERCCHCNLNMFGVLHNVSRTGFVCWQIWAFGAASTFKFWFVPFFAPARECLCVCVCVCPCLCAMDRLYTRIRYDCHTLPINMSIWADRLLIDKISTDITFVRITAVILIYSGRLIA